MAFYNWDMLPIRQEETGLTVRQLFGEKIQMQHVIAEPGGASGAPRTRPDHEAFFYIQAGEWEFTVGEDTRKLAPGDVVHIPPGEAYAFRLSGYEPGMLLEVTHPLLNEERAKDRGLFTIDSIMERMEFTEEPDEMNRGRPPEKG